MLFAIITVVVFNIFSIIDWVMFWVLSISLAVMSILQFVCIYRMNDKK